MIEYETNRNPLILNKPIIKMSIKKAQISIEYLIIISFVIMLLLTTLGFALFYSSEISEKIKFNQLERFAKKITTSAESVFYSGETSKLTFTAYLPEGIKSIQIIKTEKIILFNVSTQSGAAVIAYSSNVPIDGSLSPSAGLKRIEIVAETNAAVISER